MQKLLRNNKKFLLFILVFLIAGLFSGFIYYNLLSDDIKFSISNTLINYDSFCYNSIIKDLIITSSLLVTSLFLVGSFFGLFYLFYEFLSFGLLITIFFVNFKLSGLFYILIYILVNKCLVLFLYIIFIKKIINISRLIIGYFIYRKDKNILNNIILNFKNGIYIIIFILIINIFLYFITPSIFSNLVFLLQ